MTEDGGFRYEEFAPHPRLADTIQCLWSLRGPAGAPEADVVLPDGCPEIVVHLADPFRRVVAGGTAEQPEVSLAGQLRQPLHLLPTGVIDLLGIRFRPAGLHVLVPAELAELGDRQVDLRDVHRRLAAGLRARVRPDAPPRARVAAAQAVLLDALHPTRRGDGILLAAIRDLEAHSLDIDALARRHGCSRRHLERGFRREVGLSPKLFARIARFQRVVQRAQAGPVSWSRLAVQCGFVDQAHLIRDFRTFSGTTPAAYFRGEHAIAECLTADPLSRFSNTGAAG